MPKTSRRKIVIEDLLKLKFVSDPQMSPDGARVIFVVKTINEKKNKYFSHLWMVCTNGGEPRQFTHGEVGDGSPRWSPDGKQIAFIRSKDKKTQIHLIHADGGEARVLTHLEQGGIGNLAWSPRGNRLAFTFSQTPDEWTEKAAEECKKKHLSTPPRVITRLRYRLDGAGFLGGRSHVWIADTSSGTAKRLTDGDYDHHSLCWSPDGKTLAFFSNRSADPDVTPHEVDLWLLPVHGGKLRKIPTPRGYKGNTAWSPDGKFIAYTGHVSADDPWVPRNDGVWIVPVHGGAAKNLTASLDRTVGNATICDTRDAFAGGAAPVWSADNRSLFFTVSDCGNAHFYSVGVDGGKPVGLTCGAMDVTGYSADNSRERFALTIGNATEMNDVFLFNTSVSRPMRLGTAAATTRLTHCNQAFETSVAIAAPEEVWVKNPDGTRIQSWILRPPNFNPRKKYPLVFYIHGGPHAQYGNAFFHEFQMLAARGYVVMFTNPRGSSGREETFMSVIRGDWGNVDYKDLMAAANYATRLPYVDKKRMAVAGGSYGGYMTNWIVGHTHRFVCGITDRCVVNLASFAGTSDFPFRDNGYWKGNAWDDAATLVKHSPLTYAANVKTPLLIIHSEGDLRCPISQAEEFYTALKKLKREVVFVRYPQETSHGMSRGGPPDLRVHRLQQITAWLEKYLKP